MRYFIALLFLNISILASYSQPLKIERQRCIGGTEFDRASSLIHTLDGGYAFAGSTESNDGDVTGNHAPGWYDFWVVKLDDKFRIEWQKCLGGRGEDYAECIIQTKDGYFVVAGESNFADGDFNDSHGKGDAVVVKLNSRGDVVWKKCYGGSDYEDARSIIETADGGYIFAGMTRSNDGEVSGNHGYIDDWVVKLDTAGNIQWQQCFGGRGLEEADLIAQLSDESYIVSGHGGRVVKVNSKGVLQWKKKFGGGTTGRDHVHTIIPFDDGSYLIAANLDSVWVAKFTASDEVIWQRHLGGAMQEALSLLSIPQKGFMLAGGINYRSDAWFAKLNPMGEIEYERTFGNPKGYAYISSFLLSSDTSFVAIGYVDSNGGDISGAHGASDVWMIKLTTPPLRLSKLLIDPYYPNPVSNEVKIEYYSPTYSDVTVSIFTDIGQQIFSSLFAYQPRQSTITLDFSNYAIGTYFVTLSAGGDSQTSQVKVIR